MAPAAAAAAAAKSLQSCPTLCDPRDGGPPGSPVPGILQARTLEWAAISFSNAWKWKVKVKSLSHVRLQATSWIAAHQAPPSMGFSRQEYWSGVPLPSPVRHGSSTFRVRNRSDWLECHCLPKFVFLLSPKRLRDVALTILTPIRKAVLEAGSRVPAGGWWESPDSPEGWLLHSLQKLYPRVVRLVQRAEWGVLGNCIELGSLLPNYRAFEVIWCGKSDCPAKLPLSCCGNSERAPAPRWDGPDANQRCLFWC